MATLARMPLGIRKHANAYVCTDLDTSEEIRDRIGDNGSGEYFHSYRSLSGTFTGIDLDACEIIEPSLNREGQILQDGYEQCVTCSYTVMRPFNVPYFYGANVHWLEYKVLKRQSDGFVYRVKVYDYYVYLYSERIREDSGNPLRAEQVMTAVKRAKPDEPTVTTTGFASLYEAKLTECLIENVEYLERDETLVRIAYSEFLQVRNSAIYTDQYRTGIGGAMLNAIESLPDIAYGSLMNIKEIVSGICSIASLLRGNPKNNTIQGLKGLGRSVSEVSAKEAWLAYRYSYNTTKMDIEEYAELSRRLSDLARVARGTITCRGFYDVAETTYRVSFQVPLKNLLPKDLQEWLDLYGFDISPVAIWDGIPFSFMLDWFLDVGGLLERCGNWYKFINLPLTNFWSSAETRIASGSIYRRHHGEVYPKFPLTFTAASEKTLVFRVLDAISILT